MQKDVALGGHVLLHGAVDIQMVGGDVGDHRDVRAAAQGNELEAGKLHHRVVLRTHRFNLREEGLADVPPQVDPLPLGPEHLRNKGGGGGLAVAPRHPDNGAGAEVEEHLQVAGDDLPRLPGGGKLRQVEGDAGGPEDDVLLQGPQIIIPQGKGDPGLLHLLADFPQLLPVLAVVDGDMDALCRQHPGDAVVGDPKAHQPHLSGAEHLKKIGDALFHSQNTCLP